MSAWYILDNNNNPVAKPVFEAAQWLEDNDHRRTLKRDEIGDILVSTVFLGLDHSFPWNEDKTPVLWETMIFGGEHNQYQERYTSHKDALEGHEKALTLITKKNNMAKLNEEIQRAIDNVSDTLYREEIYINNKHEYDYHKLEAAKNVTVHTLYFSDDDEWSDSMKKQVAMQLVDNGDGIEIIGACNKKNLDYLEAEQLHILLRLSSTHVVYQIAEPTPKKEF